MSIITKRAIPRRAVLRGVGATVALPLLDSMVPALTALSRTAARPVARFGVFYVPNGMSIAAGDWPSLEGPPEESLTLTPILRPLESFRSNTLVLSGLSNAPANARSGEGVGDHSRASGCYLTCEHIKKTQGADIQAAVSLDQLAAAQLGRDTELGSLQFALESIELLGACDAGYSCVYQGTISWRTPTTPLPMETDPRAMFERLFSDGKSDRASREAQARRDRSILDALTHQVTRLQKELGAADRAKLTQYLDALRDVERRIQIAERRTADLPVVDRPTSVPDDFEEHFHLMFDLLTLAYQADLARVFTFLLAKEQGSKAYPRSGVPDSHHGTSHHAYNPATMAKLTRINAYHMLMFASFLEKLRTISDGDGGTLFDQSLILYGGGIGDSDYHNHDELPTVLVGGRHVTGGRHLRFAKGTPLANLHLALLHKLGLPATSFGDSTGELAGL